MSNDAINKIRKATLLQCSHPKNKKLLQCWGLRLRTREKYHILQKTVRGMLTMQKIESTVEHSESLYIGLKFSSIPQIRIAMFGLLIKLGSIMGDIDLYSYVIRISFFYTWFLSNSLYWYKFLWVYVLKLFSEHFKLYREIILTFFCLASEHLRSILNDGKWFKTGKILNSKYLILRLLWHTNWSISGKNANKCWRSK